MEKELATVSIYRKIMYLILILDFVLSSYKISTMYFSITNIEVWLGILLLLVILGSLGFLNQTSYYLEEVGIFKIKQKEINIYSNKFYMYLVSYILYFIAKYYAMFLLVDKVSGILIIYQLGIYFIAFSVLFVIVQFFIETFDLIIEDK